MTDEQKSARAWAKEAFARLDAKLCKVAVRSQDKIPYTMIDGVHDNRETDDLGWWTNGFWGGLNWLMYAQTKNEVYKTAARKNEQKLDGVLRTPKQLHHDVGFMWHLSAGLDYKLTGSEEAFNRDYLAAMTLMSRFNLKGGYIRAWNGDDCVTWSIVDCMMNIPLLFWASEEIKDDRFAQIAVRHANTAMAQHVREDGTVRHIVVHDDKSGAFVKNLTGQGYSETSCWSRGAAWALYGFAIAYAHTGNKDYLKTSVKVADNFIEAIEKTGYLPLSDFAAPAEPVLYDSTAGACAACGMLQLYASLGEKEGKKYLAAAVKLLQTMEKNWCDYSDKTDGILTMGREAYGSDKNMYIIYGDFFFVEAVTKLLGSDLVVW